MKLQIKAETIRRATEVGASLRRLFSVLLACLALASTGHFAAFASDAGAVGLGYLEPFDPEEIDHRLLLIGDAGAPDPEGEPALATLHARAKEIPSRTTVVFLGDNVYETGMPDATDLEGTETEEILDDVLLNLFESRSEAEARLDEQIDAVISAGAQAIFVPGNHDWDQFGVGGWERVCALDRYIRRVRKLGANVELIPSGGCPGPVSMDLGARLRIVALDTQWWLDTGIGGKPSPDDNSTGCAHVTEASVRRGLERQLVEAGERYSVVVAHHPLRSHGPHGGHYGILDHIFPIRMFSSYVPSLLHWTPLPFFGSAIVGWRQLNSPSVQDLSNSSYEHMRAELVISMEIAKITGHEPLIFAAGHDHSLQVFDEPFGPTYSLVSGLGSSGKASVVTSGPYTLFAHSSKKRPGLMQVDFARSGRVRLAVFVWSPRAGEPKELYARELKRAERQQQPIPTR